MTLTGRAVPAARVAAPNTAPLGANPADLAEVERIVKAAGTSFYRGMRILPPDRRAAMYAIYAFCRLVDDIADEPAPIEDKRRGLAAWRERIAGLSKRLTEEATSAKGVAAVARLSHGTMPNAAVSNDVVSNPKPPGAVVSKATVSNDLASHATPSNGVVPAATLANDGGSDVTLLNDPPSSPTLANGIGSNATMLNGTLNPKLPNGVGSNAVLPNGVAAEATTRVLLPAMRQFGLREADFLAVIDGMTTDAETVVVAPTEAELDLYCDQVASAVGRLSVRAFGSDTAAADQVAWHLGRALQLTNILRDLGEDAARGRLYLPREWLLAADVPCQPAAALASPGLPAVCRRGSRKAHAHFAAAKSAMMRCNRQAMRPARLMAANYKALLAELDRRGWQTPAVRVSLPWWRKLLVAAKVAL
jgi:phytoene synthase